jgi:DNA helicase-2/ATP-dependent DNA helicase PcrA
MKAHLDAHTVEYTMTTPTLDTPRAARASVEAAPSARQRLNAQQLAAVEHPATAGPLLVVAGAGSGKTATLAARAAQHIEQGVAPTRLMLLTFSRRAAREMQRRVGQALHEALGLPARTAPPQLPWCGTFHSVAMRLLREAAPQVGLHAGFTVLDRGDAEDLMGLVRQELGLAARARRFPLPGTCLAIHSRAVNTGQALATLLARDYPWCSAEHDDLERLLAAFAAAKRGQHSLDYDDLLLAWWHLMQDADWARRIAGRFDAVLVDEAQDINHLQVAIVQALRPRGSGLTLVGDDAQAIYGFRGAEVRHLLDFPARYLDPPARVLLLERNYRSTAPILDASNAVIALAERRYAKNLWTDRDAQGNAWQRPALRTVADESAQAEGVADAVLAARERGLRLMRQAVLFRTSHHSAALELALARRHIPFVKYGGLRFIESAHVKDLLAVLRWADNPQASLAAWRVARLVPGLGPAHARKVVQTLAQPQAFRPPAAAAPAWAELMRLMSHLRSEAARWPDDLARALAWFEPHLRRLYDDAPLRLADLQQLAAMAPSHAGRTAFVSELAIDPPAASSDEARDPNLDEDYLILSTIHSAKGQEWNAVHVLNVVDGCMPADLATAQQSEIEEERRLLYVAMTRARDELTLWAPQRFYVTQQRVWGDRHLYAIRTRFIPDALLPLFDTDAPEDVYRAVGAVGIESEAQWPAPLVTAAACAGAGSGSGLDLLQRLFEPPNRPLNSPAEPTR